MKILSEHYAEITGAFAVESLALFGSAARDDAGPESDIDILARFKAPPTFDQYMDLKFFIEDLLGSKVDLVTPGGLRECIRPSVEKDVLYVA